MELQILQHALCHEDKQDTEVRADRTGKDP